MSPWILLFSLIAAVALALPLVRGGASVYSPVTGEEDTLPPGEDPSTRRQLEELDLDLAMGKLMAEDHREMVVELLGGPGETNGEESGNLP